MKGEWITLGLFWLMTHFYPNIISRFAEPMLIVIVLLAAVGYSMNQFLRERDISFTYSSKSIALMCNGIIKQLRGLGTYFLILAPLFVTRTFIFDVSRVVSGSLKPTVLVNDIILTKKYYYGLRLPIVGTQLLAVHPLQRGDIVSFRSIDDRFTTMVKRVVGLPGDCIQYQNKQLTINGQVANQRILALVREQERAGDVQQTLVKSEENLQGRKHEIYTHLDEPVKVEHSMLSALHSSQNFSIIVPKGHYFMMGDNRDNSLDSRHKGCVPEDRLLGKVSRIIFSWESESSWGQPLTWIRWKRLGKTVI